MFLSSYRNTSGSLGEQEMLWEYELQASVCTVFLSSPKLSQVFCITHQKHGEHDSISFRKHRNEKKDTTCYLWLSKCKFSLLMPSLCQQLVLVLCLNGVIKTQFLTIQHAYFLRTVSWYNLQLLAWEASCLEMRNVHVNYNNQLLLFTTKSWINNNNNTNYWLLILHLSSPALSALR